MVCEIATERMLGSSMSYSKLGKMIADTYGVPIQRAYGNGTRAVEIMAQIIIVVREEARRAAEEAAFRAFQAAAEHLPGNPEDGLWVPALEIPICEGGVGSIKTHPFNSQRNGR